MFEYFKRKILHWTFEMMSIYWQKRMPGFRVNILIKNYEKESNASKEVFTGTPKKKNKNNFITRSLLMHTPIIFNCKKADIIKMSYCNRFPVNPVHESRAICTSTGMPRRRAKPTMRRRALFIFCPSLILFCGSFLSCCCQI